MNFGRKIAYCLSLRCLHESILVEYNKKFRTKETTPREASPLYIISIHTCPRQLVSVITTKAFGRDLSRYRVAFEQQA